MKKSSIEELTDRLETLSFEDSFLELEKVVEALEGGDLTLDQSLTLYEQGKILALHCSKLLEQAETRVKLLSNEQLLTFEE